MDNGVYWSRELTSSLCFALLEHSCSQVTSVFGGNPRLDWSL